MKAYYICEWNEWNEKKMTHSIRQWKMQPHTNNNTNRQQPKKKEDNSRRKWFRFTRKFWNVRLKNNNIGLSSLELHFLMLLCALSLKNKFVIFTAFAMPDKRGLLCVFLCIIICCIVSFDAFIIAICCCHHHHRRRCCCFFEQIRIQASFVNWNCI